MLGHFKKIISFAFISLLLSSGVRAFETQALAAYVVDLETETVMLSKQENVALPPASIPASVT